MTKQQEKLLKINRLSIGDSINKKDFQYIREALLNKMGTGSPEIKIHFTSNGGDASVGRDIYDFLLYYPGKKIGIGHAWVASAAAVILQACDWRVATRNTGILIHNPSHTSGINLETLNNAEKRQKVIDELEWFQSMALRIFSERTKQPISVINERCTNEKAMKAEEALKFGLIDQVIVTDADIRAPWMENKEDK